MKLNFSWATNNLTNKIVALVLAIFIWIVAVTSVLRYNTEDLMDMVVITIIETRNLNHDLLSIYEPIEVTIQIRLPKSQQNVVSNDIVAYVNLEDKGAGQHSVPVEIVCPQYCEVIKISPSRHVVELKRIISKEFAITLGTNANATLSPNRATVEGIEEKLDLVDKVVAVVVGQSGDDTIANLIAIDGFGKQVEGVSIYPSSIAVRVEQELGDYVKKVAVNAKIDFHDESVIVKEIEVTPKEVLISGKKEAIETVFNLMTTSIIVDADGGVYEATIEVPKGIILLEEEIVEVRVVTSSENEQ